MPLRDLMMAAVVFGFLPMVFARPEIGILLWTWVGLMNPHRLTYRFAYDFPWAIIIGLVTIVAVFLSREKKQLPMTGPTFTLVLFVIWMTVTTYFSLYPGDAWPQWEKVMKIQLFIFLTLMMMQRKDRIIPLVWVSTLSLAFYGVKGGIFTILGGGSGMVQGPSGGFIQGNTEISLALVMTIPLMRWLQLNASKRWVRRGMIGAQALTAIAIVGSYSRGGFLALCAMGLFLWLKSAKKALITMALLVLAPAILMSMPAKWYDKMDTMINYQQNGSALSRLNTWEFSFNMANARPLTGGGFMSYQQEAFLRWAPNPADVHDSHSIWFQVMGEHGYVGFFLYIILWLATWMTGSRIIRNTANSEEFKWAGDLARMIQVSLVGFFVGGSFLTLAVWDYPYVLMAILVLTDVVVRRSIATARERREIFERRVPSAGVPIGASFAMGDGAGPMLRRDRL